MNEIVASNLFFEVDKFVHAQRVAKMLSTSTMLPEHFRGEANIGNIMIALNYAYRIQADPFMVMQNMYVVHGRPGIEAKLAIAALNSSGKFSPLKYRFDEAEKGCIAYAKDLKSGEVCESVMVTMKMATDEGWIKNSKWKTMPRVMMTYRSAMFFIRAYAPEVLLGMYSVDEVRELPIDITPREVVEVPPMPAIPAKPKTAIAEFNALLESDPDGAIKACAEAGIDEVETEEQATKAMEAYRNI